MEYAVEMRHIDKMFPGTHALCDVGFAAERGSVHALVGPNGAGKSTLMKILSGVIRPDRGELLIGGKKYVFAGVREAQEAGIAFIHQELSLLYDRKVYQNIFLGDEKRRSKIPLFTDEKGMILETERIMGQLGFSVEPDVLVNRLSVAQQQMVEIAGALRRDSRVLIMDEPTSSLSRLEIEQLIRVIRVLREKGCCVIYISHHMEEIFEVADFLTVMRDGRVVKTGKAAEFTRENIVNFFSGHKNDIFKKKSQAAGRELLRTEAVSGSRFHNCSIYLREKEIVSITGMVGAGRSELVKAIFGIEKIDSGEIYVRNQKINCHNRRGRLTKGIGFLPEDRKQEGLVMGMDIEKNVVLADLPQVSRFGVILDVLQSRCAGKACKAALFMGRTDCLPESLSGGNQQKILMAKWLCTQCDILIFDEPTRGIDIVAKNEIYRLMEMFAASGRAVLVVSSDQMEVVRISDRAYVMKEGIITAHLSLDEITGENIMGYAV